MSSGYSLETRTPWGRSATLCDRRVLRDRRPRCAPGWRWPSSSCSSPSDTTSLAVSSTQSRPVMPRSNRPSATYCGISWGAGCGPRRRGGRRSSPCRCTDGVTRDPQVGRLEQLERGLLERALGQDQLQHGGQRYRLRRQATPSGFRGRSLPVGSRAMPPQHGERHLSHRAGWLRAAVLGANDGIVSTASLILGVAAADASRDGGAHRGRGRAGGRRALDGPGRVRLGELAARHRAGRHRQGAVGARERPRPRAGRAHRHLPGARGCAPSWPGRSPSSSPTGDALAGPPRRGARHHRDPSWPDPSRPAWSSAVSFAVGAALPLLAAALVPASASSGAAHRGHRRGRPRRPLRPRRAGRPSSAGPASVGPPPGWWSAALAAMAITMAIGKLFGTAIG